MRIGADSSMFKDKAIRFGGHGAISPDLRILLLSLVR